MEDKIGTNVLFTKQSYLLLMVSFGLGLIFNYFFYEKEAGISVVLFVLLFYAAFFWFHGKNTTIERRYTLVLLIPIILIGVTFTLYSSPLFRFLNVLFILLLISTQTILWTRINRHSWSQLQFIEDLLERGFFQPLRQIFKPFSILSHLTNSTGNGRDFTVLKKILIGLVITVPLLVIVVLLLSSADMVFRHVLSQNPFSDVSFGSFFFQTILVILVTILIFSYMWSLLYPQEKGRVNKEKIQGVVPSTSEQEVVELTPTIQGKQGVEIERVKWDPIIMITMLVMMNLVYLLFSSIQFSYLFGGAQFMLPSNFSFAEYARKGFFELVIVSIINFSILISTLYFINKKNRLLYKIVQGLLSLINISTIILLFSAYHRLSLYEQAYGYTHSRIYAHAFMIFLFILLLVLLAGIWSKRVLIVKWFIIISVSYYTMFQLINIDLIIAKNNVDRYFQTERIDMYYLKMLSYDATPEIVRLLKSTEPKLVSEVRLHLIQQEQVLKKEQRHWSSYNYGKQRAKQIISNVIN